MAIYWIEVDKVVPNPYQPRVDFDTYKLQDLADSIRQYGVLQPIVVNKTEKMGEDGNMSTVYELIAGERRTRASRLAGLRHIPAVVRDGSVVLDEKTKFELAIIENIQREDLNPIERARAFKKLQTEFGLRHSEIAGKVGKSREYVTNSIRLLVLPDEILEGILQRKINEGHARTLLTLYGKQDEQKMLFHEIVNRKLTVRDAELFSKQIISNRFRRTQTPNTLSINTSNGEHTNTTDIEKILVQRLVAMLGIPIQVVTENGTLVIRLSTDEAGTLCDTLEGASTQGLKETTPTDMHEHNTSNQNEQQPAKKEIEEEDEDFYSFKNFSI